jgi:ubiquinone/menaquinone biosynthesis C-methylase UbiE
MSSTIIDELIIPPEVRQRAVDSLGTFFEPISKVDRAANAKEFLDLTKAYKRAAILQRYTSIRSKKLLEVGSGFGTSLAVWIKAFGADGFGVEPGSEGFNEGLEASRAIFAANGLDLHRLQEGVGESLPFPDESFDIVYSANILEHTRDPEAVLTEGIRVLRKGGILHMEFPNHLSYFEGHYLVMQPPLVFRWMLPAWVQLVYRRDPSFARTLQTQINPIWARRAVRKLRTRYEVDLVSLGEELFLERLSGSFVFETQMVAGHLGKVIGMVQGMNRGNWIGRAIVAAQGHFPIYLTLRRV